MRTLQLQLLAAILICFGAAAQPTQRTLTNRDIVSMVQAQIAKDLIIEQIAESLPEYALFPEALIALKNAGVPDDIVRAMAARQHNEPVPGARPRIIQPASAPMPAAVKAIPVASTASEPMPAVHQPPRIHVGRDGDMDLHRGRVELRAIGGINVSTDRGSLSPKVPPSFGAEVTAGVARFAAITGGYSYDYLGKLRNTTCTRTGCISVDASGRLHELYSGMRFSAANRSHVTPYANVMIGGVHLSANSYFPDTGGFSISGARATATKFAVIPGGGIDFKINRTFGTMFDIRAVKGMDLKWIFRASAGFYVRFP